MTTWQETTMDSGCGWWMKIFLVNDKWHGKKVSIKR